MKKRVLAITGIRSEYDILFPVLDSLHRDERFQVQVVVCGAHLSEWHNLTVKAIENDGFPIVERIDYLLMTNRKVQRAKGTGILIQGLAQTVERENPHFLLVVGDREESIATAIVANYLDILAAHIGGGDTVYGNADDPIRFAVSQLAHIHFPLSTFSAQNLLKIGEEPFRVCCAGDPALDNIKRVPVMDLKAISSHLDFDLTHEKYLVLLQHPLSSQKEKAYASMKITLAAIEAFAEKYHIKAVGIYPNTDPGSADIIKAIEEHRHSNRIQFFKNLPREIFVNVMRHAIALAGNSSMGILEAPFYRCPVVNIGDRQKGREQAGNVCFVEEKTESIIAALEKACFNQEYRDNVARLDNPFGDGYAAEKIRDFLAGIDLTDNKWYIKKKFCN